MEFSDADMTSILTDMVIAEEMAIPGPAKQAWVISEQASRQKKSPSPVWIWILIEVLQAVIPKLLEWLKKKYGPEWTEKISKSLSAGALPWQS